MNWAATSYLRVIWYFVYISFTICNFRPQLLVNIFEVHEFLKAVCRSPWRLPAGPLGLALGTSQRCLCRTVCAWKLPNASNAMRVKRAWLITILFWRLVLPVPVCSEKDWYGLAGWMLAPLHGVKTIKWIAHEGQRDGVPLIVVCDPGCIFWVYLIRFVGV